MSEKTAIIATGGGMRCSYAVGAIKALIEKYGLTQPDLAIGGSGNAGTLAYFTAGQLDSVENIWSNKLSTRRFIDRLRIRKVIDIDYLIDEVFKKQDPLNLQKLRNSPTECLVPATNAKTGQLAYFSNRGKEDFFEVLRAAKAMPAVYGKKIRLNGSSFHDTHLSAHSEAHIMEAVARGAKRIVVIDTSSDAWIKKLMFRLWVSSRPFRFRKNYLLFQKRLTAATIPAGVQLAVLKPGNKLKIATLQNSRRALIRSIQQGYTDLMNNLQVKNMFKVTS